MVSRGWRNCLASYLIDISPIRNVRRWLRLGPAIPFDSYITLWVQRLPRSWSTGLRFPEGQLSFSFALIQERLWGLPKMILDSLNYSNCQTDHSPLFNSKDKYVPNLTSIPPYALKMTCLTACNQHSHLTFSEVDLA